MPDTQVERISQLDIGDGKLYEFAGANNGMVFNNVTEALAAIQTGTVADGDVFYIKNDGTSGYPVFIGTSAQIATADNAGKIPAGMLIYCTDDSVNDITALQVGYDNTDSGLEADTAQGAIDELNNDLTNKADKNELPKHISTAITLDPSDISSGVTISALYEKTEGKVVALSMDFNTNVVKPMLSTLFTLSNAMPVPTTHYFFLLGNADTGATVTFNLDGYGHVKNAAQLPVGRYIGTVVYVIN